MDHNSTQFGIVQTIDSNSIMEHSIALASIPKISYLSWWFAFYLQSKYVQNISLFDQRPFSSSSFPLSFFGGGGGGGRGGFRPNFALEVHCTTTLADFPKYLTSSAMLWLFGILSMIAFKVVFSNHFQCSPLPSTEHWHIKWEGQIILVRIVYWVTLGDPKNACWRFDTRISSWSQILLFHMCFGIRRLSLFHLDIWMLHLKIS